LTVALRALGVTEAEIDWSHEPALGLRPVNDAGTDYVPPQHSVDHLFIRKRPDHDHITFKNNGTGRGDLTAIAHVKRVSRKHQQHRAAIEAKVTGDDPPAPRRRKRAIAARVDPWPKGRKLQNRNDLRRRP
jgi:hypothetical protein